MTMNFAAALPEFIVVIGAIALLMVGVFAKAESSRLVTWAGVAVLAAAAVVLLTSAGATVRLFNGALIVDRFANFMKVLVLLAAALGLIMSLEWNARAGNPRFEFPVLLLFAVTGMMLMISANDLISLYVGLELQSLALYVVAAFQRDQVRSTEAGLKYFVLGALSSGLLLYGASLVYGFTGTTSFDGIAQIAAASRGGPPLGLVFGMVFVIAGLAFKISGAPFHMWTPDVYEGAPTPVTAFFAVAPKIAAFALTMRVLIEPFGPLIGAWQQIVVFVAVLSMLVGAFAAIWQQNIKRLMAYSSIGHIGYGLVGLVAGGEAGVQSVIIYLAIYLFMNVGTFAVILSMRRDGQPVETIGDLAGLARDQPLVAAALAVAMFSMAGIPPLAGFFGKLYVFLAAVNAGFVTLAVVGVLASVVGAFYYLRIIKLMYFDAATAPLERPIGATLGIVLAGSTAFTLLFFLIPAPLVAGARVAAASLLAP